MTAQAERAALFRDLHRGERLLVLANAWDPVSARLIEAQGAPALATTSAGLAWSRGYADGDRLPPKELIAAVRAIARVVRVPLSVDVESGYATDPAAVADVVAEVIRAGAVGVNIEDGTEPPEVLAAKIRAVRSAAAHLGVEVFVNARTDVLLRGLAADEDRADEVVRRAALYAEAGADGLFVPGVVDVGVIATLARAVVLPLNVMALPGLPSAAELLSSGARRLSAGAAIAQAALGLAHRLTGEFLSGGDSRALFAHGHAEYATLNGLLLAGPGE